MFSYYRKCSRQLLDLIGVRIFRVASRPRHKPTAPLSPTPTVCPPPLTCWTRSSRGSNASALLPFLPRFDACACSLFFFLIHRPHSSRSLAALAGLARPAPAPRARALRTCARARRPWGARSRLCFWSTMPRHPRRGTRAANARACLRTGAKSESSKILENRDVLQPGVAPRTRRNTCFRA